VTTKKCSINGKKNIDKIEKLLLKYLGVLGYAKAGIMFVKKDENVILAINRSELEKVKSALALSKIPVKKVSGTIKGLQ